MTNNKMAMRILASRLVQQSATNGVPLRVCTASMASSTPAPTSSKVPANPSGQKPKRESWKSKIAHIYGGNLDAADPNEPPISAKDIRFPDPVEWATGEEKLFMLAFENGIIDPYCNLPVERGDKGTKEDPVIIESFFDDRMIACACEPSQTYHKYMYVYKNEMKRCQCGWWFKCVDAPRFWEKIPKEDLLGIPFFRDLEEDGKLDKFLETGKIDDDYYPQLGQA